MTPEAKTILKFVIPISAVLLFFLFCFRTVSAGEVGVITRFGEVNREVNSGIALKLPWPIERMYKLDVRTNKEEVKAPAATADMQDANTTLAINYRLERGRVIDVFKNIGTDYKNRVLIPAAQETFKSTTARYSAQDLLSKRMEVKQAALKSLQENMAPKGIIVDDIAIVDFGFSAAFNEAIEQKQVAQQNAEKAKYLSEKARHEADAAIEQARGTAEAQRLISSTATQESLQRLLLDKWDGKLPQYVGGTDAIFNIPLKGAQ